MTPIRACRLAMRPRSSAVKLCCATISEVNVSSSRLYGPIAVRSFKPPPACILPPPLLDRCARLPIGVPPLDCFALVVFLLPLRQADCDLHAAVLEVHPHRDERHPFLDRLPHQLQDFVAVQQPLSAA